MSLLWTHAQPWPRDIQATYKPAGRQASRPAGRPAGALPGAPQARSAGPLGTGVFPQLRKASFLSGPAPASRVASGERHGGQRPTLKILESFGGVAAWASLLASVHGVGLVQQRNKPFPFL